MLKALLRKSMFRFLRSRGYGVYDLSRAPIEATAAELRIIDAVRPYTMTPVDRIWALLNAVSYVVRKPIDGAIVECGVWRGGSMMAAAMQLREAAAVRDLYLYDTFAGMTVPTDFDRDGEPALTRWRSRQRAAHNEWAYSPLEEVTRNLRSTGHPQERIHFIKGAVEETLRDGANLPERIALLRLDTDWYESTRIELEVLYPRLAQGGVLIIDDFGDWAGSQKAATEYIEANALRLLLHRVDDSARLCLKV